VRYARYTRCRRTRSAASPGLYQKCQRFAASCSVSLSVDSQFLSEPIDARGGERRQHMSDTAQSNDRMSYGAVRTAWCDRTLADLPCPRAIVKLLRVAGGFRGLCVARTRPTDDLPAREQSR
jgi:hypothetical protein